MIGLPDLAPLTGLSVTVVEPPVMVDLEPNHRRQIYTSCITALEEMIQDLSPLEQNKTS